jgi:hypothetical protein
MFLMSMILIAVFEEATIEQRCHQYTHTVSTVTTQVPDRQQRATLHIHEVHMCMITAHTLLYKGNNLVRWCCSADESCDVLGPFQKFCV